MKIYYITGTSKGLGKAISEVLLQDSENFVIGISRNKTIENKNYKHISVDLSKPESVIDFKFDIFDNAASYTLINNAGIIGDIKHIGDIDNKKIIDTYNVNIVSPSILINNFVRDYKSVDLQKTILNISSGAGRHSIESWSSYCASKAAMDMFSLVANDDFNYLSGKNFKIFSIAPGIVDTPMQDDIRAANKDDFSMVENFKTYKNQNLLSSPYKIAKQLIVLINKNIDKIILDVRE